MKLASYIICNYILRIIDHTNFHLICILHLRLQGAQIIKTCNASNSKWHLISDIGLLEYGNFDIQHTGKTCLNLHAIKSMPYLCWCVSIYSYYHYLMRILQNDFIIHIVTHCFFRFFLHFNFLSFAFDWNKIYQLWSPNNIYIYIHTLYA